MLLLLLLHKVPRLLITYVSAVANATAAETTGEGRTEEEGPYAESELTYPCSPGLVLVPCCLTSAAGQV